MKAIIYRKRSEILKNTLYALIAFITVLLIALSYQQHLTDLCEQINLKANNVILSIEISDYNETEKELSELKTMWENNFKILMAFQDHSSVNDAGVFLALAINCFRTEEYNQVSDNLISFTEILNELAGENMPYIENIL